MLDSMTIQPSTFIFIGALLLSLITVETGGYFLVRVNRGSVPANDLQRSFFRAGHAHAAVLVVLGIVILSVVDAAGLAGFWGYLARAGVPIAAILMPAGFFLSVLGKDPKRPNRLFILLWVGVATLTLGLGAAGIGLIAAGIEAL